MSNSLEFELFQLENQLRRVVGLDELEGNSAVSSEFRLNRIRELVSSWNPSAEQRFSLLGPFNLTFDSPGDFSSDGIEVGEELPADCIVEWAYIWPKVGWEAGVSDEVIIEISVGRIGEGSVLIYRGFLRKAGVSYTRNSPLVRFSFIDTEDYLGDANIVPTFLSHVFPNVAGRKIMVHIYDNIGVAPLSAGELDLWVRIAEPVP